MNVKQALIAAADADTVTGEFANRFVRDLPKGDVVVQRSLLRQAIKELERLEEMLRQFR